MHSIKLTQAGLSHYVAGSAYNFRQAEVGEQVIQDANRALATMGIQPQALYSGTQVHGVNIEYCDGQTGQDGLYGKIFPDTDGLITDRPEIALLIKYADCTPIVLFDPVKKVQALLHSGWRGTVQEIASHAIERMETDFHCQREHLVAYLGPSIDQANYEVGPEVYAAFSAFPDRDQFFQPQPKSDKFKLSMLDANRFLLLTNGLKEHQIDVSRQSTIESPALHSARGEGPTYGLNALITMI